MVTLAALEAARRQPAPSKNYAAIEQLPTAGAVANLVGFPVLGYLLFVATGQWGRPLTALAGNPHIAGADADVVLPLTGAVVGLVFTLLWSLPWRRLLPSRSESSPAERLSIHESLSVWISPSIGQPAR